jgi:hypothetical protein
VYFLSAFSESPVPSYSHKYLVQTVLRFDAAGWWYEFVRSGHAVIHKFILRLSSTAVLKSRENWVVLSMCFMHGWGLNWNYCGLE